MRHRYVFVDHVLATMSREQLKPKPNRAMIIWMLSFRLLSALQLPQHRRLLIRLPAKLLKKPT